MRGREVRKLSKIEAVSKTKTKAKTKAKTKTKATTAAAKLLGDKWIAL